MFAAITRLFKKMLSDASRAAPKRKRVILELQALEHRDCPSTFTWDGPSGGNWNVGANWVGGVAPGPFDNVVFDGAYSTGDCDFTGNGYSQVANSITLESNYGGTLHLKESGPASVGSGGVELDSGGIEQDNGQDLDVAGNFTWTGGELNALSTFAANLNLSNGAAFNLRLTGNEPTGDNVNLKGSTGVVDSPGFTLTFDKNVGVNIDSSSTMNLIDGTFKTTGTGVITNAGTLEKTAGTAGFTTDLPIVNSGAFQLQNGTLTITGTDAKGSFDQSSGSTDLWASTTLTVNQGYYMNGGNLWTEGATGSISVVNGGNVLIEGGVINLLHGNQTGTGVLQVAKNLTIQGTAEYDAKIDSTNVTADKITATGTVTLGGQSTLKTVLINLVNGKVALGQTWNIISSGAANINGDFANFILDFGDGTGKKYTAGPNGKQYQVKS